MAWDKSAGRSNAGYPRAISRSYPIFAICVDNGDFEGSLQKGKVYRIIKPEAGDRGVDVRVIDEEGEDYLYPAERFVPIENLPAKAKRAVKEAVPVAT